MAVSPDLSRRGLLLRGGTAIAAAPLAQSAQAQPPTTATPDPPPAAQTSSTATLWRFFTEEQARFVTAAVDRLIPADVEFAGAVGAGVPQFIDGQLAGAWGAGERLYRHAPFAEGTPEQGYQLPFTPAELYRTALPATARWVQAAYRQPFEALDGALQDEALGRLETGEAGFDDVPSAIFFETLLANTIEGFFSDPMYGGNRDMVGWRMVGFPGPFAGYVQLLDRHDLRFTRAPRGIAQALSEHAHHRTPTQHR